jgi:SAM-dependent methyltransferase
VDRQTMGAYDRESASFAAEWEDEQPPPTDLYALVKQFFSTGATADVGCGSGRDTAWLVENGFPAVGYDPSPALLAEARRRHPGVSFEVAALPDLDGVPRRSFANVLCETVIMHLPVAKIAESVRTSVALLAPSGIVYVSWRVTANADRRDARGRLYTSFPSSLVFQALAGATVVHNDETESSSSGARIHRVIARRISDGAVPSQAD